MIERLMNNELERIWEEAVVVWFKVSYYTDICTEGLKETTQHLGQDTQSPGRIWGQDLPNTNNYEHKSAELMFYYTHKLQYFL
jgi:hypothetical protein